jgi:hypothetical protein
MIDDPVLLGTARLQQGGRAMRVKQYGERAGKSGETKAVPAEVRLCGEIYRILSAHYPGHPWSIEVHAEQGFAFITIPPLLGSNWGYVLHLDKLHADAFRASVIEAGGNLLERFEIPRSTIDLARYIELEAKHPLLGRFRTSHRALIPS